MSDASFGECVAIDTNVFIHLFDPDWNVKSHINRLLADLQGQGVDLIVDNGGRILGEYEHGLGPWIRSSDDTRNEVYLLRYWMRLARRRIVELDSRDSLMTAIRRVVIERSEQVDRIFVYVAFKVGKTLITNDLMHIVNGPMGEGTSRRHRLLQVTRRFRPRDVDIVTSREASEMVCAR